MRVLKDGPGCTKQRTATLPSIWREPLTRSEGFLLAALILALVCGEYLLRPTSPARFGDLGAGTWCDTCDHVAPTELGSACKAANGQEYPNPWLAILNGQARLMATFGSRLGLNPAARMELNVSEQ
jgi:hypothetical protein